MDYLKKYYHITELVKAKNIIFSKIYITQLINYNIAMSKLGSGQVVWDVASSYLGIISNTKEATNFDKRTTFAPQGFSNFFKIFAKISFHIGYFPWKIEPSKNSMKCEYTTKGSKFTNVR